VLKQLHLQHTTFLGTGIDDELSPLPNMPPTWQLGLEQLTVAWCERWAHTHQHWEPVHGLTPLTVHNLGLFPNITRLILEPTHYYIGRQHRASVDVVVMLDDNDDEAGNQAGH
jgi:hypothetical protein